MVEKIPIPKETMESMKEFFMKTAIPRMIAREKEEDINENQTKRMVENASYEKAQGY